MSSTMSKYKCTSKFPMLLFIDGEIVEVRPNQIIEAKEDLNYKYLNKVLPKKGRPRKDAKQAESK